MRSRICVLLCLVVVTSGTEESTSGKRCTTHSDGYCIDYTFKSCRSGYDHSFNGCGFQEVCCYPQQTYKPTTILVAPVHRLPRCRNPYSYGHCADSSKWKCPSFTVTYYTGCNKGEVCCFPKFPTKPGVTTPLPVIPTTRPTCTTHSDGFCINYVNTQCPSSHYSSYSGCGNQEVCCYPKRRIETPKPSSVHPTTGTSSGQQCGKPMVNPNTKIVGGQQTSIEAHPWQVLILYFGIPWCGGSLINNRWVLTAAHCLKRKSGINIVVGTDSSKFYPKSQVIPVEKMIDHPDYNSDGLDISLMKLSKSVDVTGRQARTICLPEKNETFDSQTCFVSGWGKIKEGGNKSQTLRHVSVPVVSSKICKFYMGVVDPWQICAGHLEGGKDACQGDSGGPLVCEGQNGVWKQAGVVSTGNGCAKPQNLGLYTNVAYFKAWIDKIISMN